MTTKLIMSKPTDQSCIIEHLYELLNKTYNTKHTLYVYVRDDGLIMIEERHVHKPNSYNVVVSDTRFIIRHVYANLSEFAYEKNIHIYTCSLTRVIEAVNVAVTKLKEENDDVAILAIKIAGANLTKIGVKH